MRKNDFLPRLAAAAVIITAIMFSNIFVKAQSNKEYQVVNVKANQDAWHNEKPCPPCPNFPVTRQESPKRLPGTNGAYVECNPNIIVNPAQCQGNNNCGMQNQNYMPVQNDGFRTWDMIACGLIFLLFGFIIGLLYKMRNNHNHGHSHHHETNHNYFGDTMIDNTGGH